MATNNELAAGRNRKLFINIMVVAVFVSLMMAFISYFYRSEPNFQDALLQQLGNRMQSGAVTAHWQWQAEGRPEMIMLVHYNKEGREIGRSPVRISYTGLPAVRPSSEGCEKLWASLLNQPMTLDGFQVKGEYYRGALLDKDPVNSRCRFRLSRGTYFDYYIYRGEVVHEEE